METLLDQLATLEMTMEGLETKERQQRQVVEELLKQMATINNNMDRTPEVRRRLRLGRISIAHPVD